MYTRKCARRDTRGKTCLGKSNILHNHVRTTSVDVFLADFWLTVAVFWWNVRYVAIRCDV